MEPKYKEEDLSDHDGICAVIKDKEGKILMQNHVKFGFWTIPVGKVKKGQSVEEGLKEEIFEECDLRITKFVELKSRNYEYLRRGNKVNVFSHLFEVQEYSGEMKNKEPEKHSEQKFISLEEIKKLPYLSDLTLFYLEYLGFIREARL